MWLRTISIGIFTITSTCVKTNAKWEQSSSGRIRVHNFVSHQLLFVPCLRAIVMIRDVDTLLFFLTTVSSCSAWLCSTVVFCENCVCVIVMQLKTTTNKIHRRFRKRYLDMIVNNQLGRMLTIRAFCLHLRSRFQSRFHNFVCNLITERKESARSDHGGILGKS